MGWPALAWVGLGAQVGMCRVVHGAPVQPRRCTELRGARATHARKAPAQLQFCTETNVPRAQSLRVRARRRPNLASVRKYARLARKGRHALRNQALAPSGTLPRNLGRLSEGQYTRPNYSRGYIDRAKTACPNANLCGFLRVFRRKSPTGDPEITRFYEDSG